MKLTDKFLLVTAILIVIILSSCGNNKSSYITIKDKNGQIAGIKISPYHLLKKGILFDSARIQNIEKWIDCSGIISVLPEKRIQVCSPLSGTVLKCYYTQGNSVIKGSTLFVLESTELVRLQSDFLEAGNQFRYQSEEYKRQGELTVENAAAIKQFQQAQRDYQSAEIRLKSFENILHLIGVNSDSVDLNWLTGKYKLKSVRQGKISSIYTHPGAYVKTGDLLCEIYDPADLLLKLSLQPNQPIPDTENCKITFSMMNNNTGRFEPGVRPDEYFISRENESVFLYFKLPGTNKILIPGMSVSGKIKIGSDTAYYVSRSVLVEKDEKTFLFILKNGVIKRIPITSFPFTNDSIDISDINILEPGDTILKGKNKFLLEQF